VGDGFVARDRDFAARDHAAFRDFGTRANLQAKRIACAARPGRGTFSMAQGRSTPTTSPTASRWPRDGWALTALERAGILTPDVVAAIRSEAPEWAAHYVVQRGLLPADTAQAIFAKAAHAPVAALDRVEPAAVQFLPEAVARQHAALPLSATNKVIRIATSNPLDFDAERALGFVTSRAVEFSYALPAPLALRIDEIYRPERSIERLVGGLGGEATLEHAEDTAPQDTDSAVEAPAARLVDATIADAVRERASELHLEPTDAGLVIRYRVDGVLREVMRVPRSAAGAVARRVKVVAKLDITDPLHPHDGRASARVDGKQWDLRVSTIPVARLGEKVVVRLRDPGSTTLSLGAMGLWPDELSSIEALLQNREGIVLVTGPTGSGKTFTLYAALDRIRTAGINVVTVEDPVEYRLEGVNQIQVNEKQGLTFATALRSVLRQDPDVVLLGEIRDLETATTAWQASLSGHLVLSTLHTNDAASSIARLRDIGIDSFKIAAALRGVLAQRLLRRLCPKCADPAGPESLPLPWQPPVHWQERLVAVRKPKGCANCGFTGYRGRFAIEEILTVDGQVAELVARGALADQIVESGRRYGMRTLWEAGLRRVWTGETGYDELVRVLGEPIARRDSYPPSPRRSSESEPVLAAMEPVAAPGIPPDAAGPAAAALGETPHRQVPLVLIADDDPALRDLENAVLHAAGLQVAESADGAEALDLARMLHPSIMLLDMDMPELTGLEVLEQLRSTLSGRGVPVIVVTAHDDPETESRCIELGAEDYITKPIQPATLVARIRAVLRRAYGGGT
jgi:type II secretory ATPase GspE/PulE/Tfp pilus assembly ATPase PilB-like protein/ActR/RegA family two-component response regulator